MADLEGYGENLDQLEMHLAAQAGVLGRFRTALIEAGFSEAEVGRLALECWRALPCSRLAAPNPRPVVPRQP